MVWCGGVSLSRRKKSVEAIQIMWKLMLMLRMMMTMVVMMMMNARTTYAFAWSKPDVSFHSLLNLLYSVIVIVAVHICICMSLFSCLLLAAFSPDSNKIKYAHDVHKEAECKTRAYCQPLSIEILLLFTSVLWRVKKVLFRFKKL